MYWTVAEKFTLFHQGLCCLHWEIHQTRMWLPCLKVNKVNCILWLSNMLILPDVNKYPRKAEPGIVEEAYKKTAILIKHEQAAFDLGLILSKERVYYGTQSFIIPPNFPWKEDLDRLTYSLLAGGIMDRIISHVSRRSDDWMREKFGKSEKRKITVISMAHMAAPFAIVITCLTFSTFVFLLEILHVLLLRSRQMTRLDV